MSQEDLARIGTIDVYNSFITKCYILNVGDQRYKGEKLKKLAAQIIPAIHAATIRKKNHNLIRLILEPRYITGHAEVYSDGNLIYKGYVKKGKYHGQGTLYNNQNKIIYIGGFRNGVYHGHGIEYRNDWPSTSYAEKKGIFRDGKFQEGKWQYLTFRPAEYSRYVEGKFDKLDTLNFSELTGYYTIHLGEIDTIYTGILYAGFLQDGKFEGYGVLYSEVDLATTQKGLFIDGLFVQGVVYRRGIKQSEGSYDSQGNYHEFVKLYDKKGKVVSYGRYDHGKLIEKIPL